jgi:hypothetical protein
MSALARIALKYRLVLSLFVTRAALNAVVSVRVFAFP